MGEAKRRKASGHDPNALAKTLVAAWDGDGDEFEGDVFDVIAGDIIRMAYSLPR